MVIFWGESVNDYTILGKLFRVGGVVGSLTATECKGHWF